MHIYIYIVYIYIRVYLEEREEASEVEAGRGGGRPEVRRQPAHKGNSNPHGARPVHLIITMIKWVRTRRLSIKNSLYCGVGLDRQRALNLA